MSRSSDPLYWAIHPLDDDDLAVLGRVQDQTQRFDRDQFSVAYLISLECLEADVDSRALTLTEKGLDGIRFHEGEAP